MYVNLPGASTSGYSASVNTNGLGPGEHTLTVAIHDHVGNTRVSQLPFTLVASAAMYHKYFLRMLPSVDEITAERRTATSAVRCRTSGSWSSPRLAWI